MMLETTEMKILRKVVDTIFVAKAYGVQVTEKCRYVGMAETSMKDVARIEINKCPRTGEIRYD